MPVRIDSRYSGAPVYDAVDANGVTHPTVGIRRAPEPAAPADLYKHVVTAVETIESLAAAYYGPSAAWWRIADQNPLAFPLDLRPGQLIALAPPSTTASAGQIQRTRRF